jgi:hypothetical protein
MCSRTDSQHTVVFVFVIKCAGKIFVPSVHISFQFMGRTGLLEALWCMGKYGLCYKELHSFFILFILHRSVQYITRMWKWSLKYISK